MISPESLRRYPLFGWLNEAELKGLAMLAAEEEFEAGDFVFREGEPASKCYLVLEGEVELLIALEYPERRRVPVSSVGPGELVAWSALIEPHVLMASARATGRARLVGFDGAALRAMCEVDHHFGFRLMSMVAHVVGARLRDTRVQLASLVVPA